MSPSRPRTKSIQVNDVLKAIDVLAPPATAEDWDPTGLLLGDPSDTVKGAVVSIDLTFEAVQKAKNLGYNLVITHHPCIFPKQRGLARVVSGSPIFEALRAGIAVAAYHTQFDRSALEVPHWVSQGLGFSMEGRLFERGGISGVVAGEGYGIWGNFRKPKSFAELTKGVNRLFDVNGFWITKPIPKLVRKVGFVAGKGASFVEFAASLKLDVLITGEAGYHVVLGAARKGMVVLELGHRQSEKFFLKTMKSWLTDLGIPVAEENSATQVIWQEE